MHFSLNSQKVSMGRRGLSVLKIMVTRSRIDRGIFSALPLDRTEGSVTHQAMKYFKKTKQQEDKKPQFLQKIICKLNLKALK